MIEHTLSAWSVELGKDTRTIQIRLNKAGFRVPKRGKLRGRVIFVAMTGDLDQERIRHKRAEADLTETKARVAREQVIDVQDVATFIRNTFAPVRSDVIELPGLLAARCNPQNPEVARQALLDWSDTFLRRRREDLPEFKTTEA